MTHNEPEDSNEAHDLSYDTTEDSNEARDTTYDTTEDRNKAHAGVPSLHVNRPLEQFVHELTLNVRSTLVAIEWLDRKLSLINVRLRSAYEVKLAMNRLQPAVELIKY